MECNELQKVEKQVFMQYINWKLYDFDSFHTNWWIKYMLHKKVKDSEWLAIFWRLSCLNYNISFLIIYKNILDIEQIFTQNFSWFLKNKDHLIGHSKNMK